MQFLHGLTPKAVLHHDLKTQNILVADDWTAKVADFGMATTLGGKDDERGPSPLSLSLGLRCAAAEQYTHACDRHRL